ncbi:MAG: ABC transporter ATP-binding protein, partial [Desulfobacterales bacterium]|nr:ABC transporter ATP-binding protein [Desulfobacterales bacterium]
AVDGVSFDVQPGEILVLLGPSGCGKTTVLRMIAGFEHADRGSVRFDGQALTQAGDTPKHVRPEHRNIGFVFQDYALFPHMSVIRNVMYGLHGKRSDRRVRALQALDLVGMTDYAERRPHELSGGQQQRVALARSLGPSPRLILLDEPFSNLDASLRENTRQEMRKLLHEQDMAAILVTHDQEEALSFADRIAVMSAGRIEQVGAPRDVYEQPTSAFAATLLGRVNLLQVNANGREADSVLGRLRLDREVHGPITVAIRPEHILLSDPSEANGVHGTVVSQDYKGHDLTYRIQVDGQIVTVQSDYRTTYPEEASVALRVVADAVVLPAH